MGEDEFSGIFLFLVGNAENADLPFLIAAQAVLGRSKDLPGPWGIHPSLQQASSTISQGDLFLARLTNLYAAEVEGVDNRQRGRLLGDGNGDWSGRRDRAVHGLNGECEGITTLAVVVVRVGDHRGLGSRDPDFAKPSVRRTRPEKEFQLPGSSSLSTQRDFHTASAKNREALRLSHWGRQNGQLLRGGLEGGSREQRNQNQVSPMSHGISLRKIISAIKRMSIREIE